MKVDEETDIGRRIKSREMRRERKRRRGFALSGLGPFGTVAYLFCFVCGFTCICIYDNK